MQFSHLSCSNLFTFNSFCLLSVFMASPGIGPFTTIWRHFIFFFERITRYKLVSRIFHKDCQCQGYSYHSLLQHIWVTVLGRYFWTSKERFGFYRHQSHGLWYLCLNFSTRLCYISSSLQWWSLLWKMLLCCFFTFRSATCLLCFSSHPFL